MCSICVDARLALWPHLQQQDARYLFPQCHIGTYFTGVCRLGWRGRGGMCICVPMALEGTNASFFSSSGVPATLLHNVTLVPTSQVCVNIGHMGWGWGMCLHGTEVFGCQALPSSLLSAVRCLLPFFTIPCWYLPHLTGVCRHRAWGLLLCKHRTVVCVFVCVWGGGVCVRVCVSVAVWCIGVDVGLSIDPHNVRNSITEISSLTAAASGR